MAPVLEAQQFLLLLPALRRGERAAGTEVAAAPGATGNVATQAHACSVLRSIGHRSINERSRVGMGRVLEYLLSAAFFDNLAQVQNHHAVAGVANTRKIV